MKPTATEGDNSRKKRVLFLDFDGVLHDAREAAFDEDHRVVLDNPRLFQHVQLLAEALAPYPDVRIIVSSDWQYLFDDEALARLLRSLGSRFAGVTEVRANTRADAIRTCALRKGIASWLALDDHESVVEASRTDARFIACPSDAGISDAVALNTLKAQLGTYNT